MGCCVPEVENFVMVSGPSVLLFDVLVFVDAFGALFTGWETWVLSYSERPPKKDPQVSQALQVSQRDRVDLALMSAKIGVPRSILCNVAFEHGLEVTVDEVQAAARLLSLACVPAVEEMRAAAPSSRDLRARSGEEEKIQEEKWSSHKKSMNDVFIKSLEGKLLFFLSEEDTVLDLQNRVAVVTNVSICACVPKSNT